MRTAAALWPSVWSTAAACLLLVSPRVGQAQAPGEKHEPAACGNDAGLDLPAGFCASIFADHLGHARHMVAAANGVLYVNTWSGSYYANSPPPPGGFLIAPACP
jgi:hypothetical protein